jgi:hypothetical protein
LKKRESDTGITAREGKYFPDFIIFITNLISALIACNFLPENLL